MTEPSTDHITKVREEGEKYLELAADVAKKWRMWANALDQLVRDMPHPPRCVVGVDELGDRYNLDLGLPHLDGAAMRNRLHVTRAEADSIASALGRGRHLAASALKDTLAYLEAAVPAHDEAAEPAHVGATEEYAGELREMNVELHGSAT